jgi:hypothetical protein
VPDSDINPAAVDRLVERVSSTQPRAKVRSAFSGTRGLAPTMVAVVGALPAVVVVVISLALGRPTFLIFAALVMAATMILIMTVVNTTVVVAELPGELALFTASRSALEPLATVPKALEIGPGGSRSWLQVHVADQVLWVSRPAFGGIVERFAVDPSTPADGDSTSEVD